MVNTLKRFYDKSQWHSAEWLISQELSAEQIDILCYQESMTARMEALGKSELQVDVLSQSWQTADRMVRGIFNLKHREYILSREVHLSIKDEVWMYARSIFPQKSLQARLYWVKTLKNKPLGSLLFHDNSTSRSPFYFKRESNTDNIVRYSLVTCDGYPFLLYEVFYPDFLSRV